MATYKSGKPPESSNKKTNKNSNTQQGRRANYSPRQRQLIEQKRKKRRRQLFFRRMVAVLVLLLALALIVFLVIFTVDKLKNAKSGSASQSSQSSQGGQGDDSAAVATSVTDDSSQGSSSVSSDITSSEPVVIDYDSPYFEAAMPEIFNFENYIPEGYVDKIELISVGARPSSGEDQKMQKKAAEAFLAMQAAAKEDGVNFTPYSGFRTHQRQLSNYNASIQRYKDQGYSAQDAERFTQQYYAIPGTSEHEAGVAMDIDGIEESFENTAAFAWLAENAEDYGFIMRYPKDKVDITHVNYEPWHYRYVGMNHAKMINELGVCLEEYLQQSAD